MDYTGIADKLRARLAGRTDLDNEMEDFIDAAMMDAETFRGYKWRHLETSSLTGTTSSSSNTISIGIRYRNMSAALLTSSNMTKSLTKVSYSELWNRYPDGSNFKGVPKVIAVKENESKFYLGPYPDGEYDYEIIVCSYSSRLTTDNLTNWWTDNGWQVLYYGAMREALESIGPTDPDTLNAAKYWDGKFEKKLMELMAVDIKEKKGGTRAAMPANTFIY